MVELAFLEFRMNTHTDPQKGIRETELSLDEMMMRRGVTVDSEFGDYQDYIEKLEQGLPSSAPFSDIVTLRGSVHLACNKAISRGEVEERLERAVTATVR